MEFKDTDIVKSCKKLESGIRLGQEGLAACAQGPFQSPIYFTPKELKKGITKEDIVNKRKEIFKLLNVPNVKISCDGCNMVYKTEYKNIDFTKLGHIDFSQDSFCNLRCDFCWYTKANHFVKSDYNGVDVLKNFKKEDVLWDSAVDFGGGEPTLLEYFDDALDFFKRMGIRVFLYTNSVKFSQKVYDGLVDGTINWVCTSVDCGIFSTFKKTKKSDAFFKVLKNLYKYSQAAQKGKGNLAIKYIFTKNNISEDDIIGFVMLAKAINPTEVWLTFDFEPMKELDPTSEDLGDYGYEELVKAYIKMYKMLKEFDLDVIHFAKKHLINVNKQSIKLMQMIQEALGTDEKIKNAIYFDDIHSLNIKNKNILIAPLTKEGINIAKILSKNNNILGFADRNPLFHNKKIDN